MIYLFTGNNRYLITEEIQRWKLAFIDKHGEENVSHISDLDSNSHITISELLNSRSLFAEKRLVIIDGFPFSGEKLFSGASELEEKILKNLDNIPEEVLIVFASINPDKRKSGYKNISKKATVKSFDVSGDDQVFSIVSKKHGKHIDASTLRRIIFLKGGSLQKTLSEVEKLLINNQTINSRLVEENIIPEFEESIFVFIDTLLLRDARKIFKELHNLINFSNLYAIYQSIIANLRIFLYIEYLKSIKIPQAEISDILKLGNRAFLIQKSHKSSYNNIERLYKNLLDFDKNMKFGKFSSSEEEDLIRELEAIFLKFLK